MARYGSEAVARTTQFEHEYAPEQSTRSSFEVVPGGGLDADARRGVSSQFIQRVKLIAVAAALFLTLGVVRIGISTATVSTLQSNNVFSRPSNLLAALRNHKVWGYHGSLIGNSSICTDNLNKWNSKTLTKCHVSTSWSFILI